MGGSRSSAPAHRVALFSEIAAATGSGSEHVSLEKSSRGHARQQFVATAAKQFVDVFANPYGDHYWLGLFAARLRRSRT
jgi:hypothetical protein